MSGVFANFRRKKARWPKNMKKKFYDHENFSQCKELRCGFKNQHLFCVFEKFGV